MRDFVYNNYLNKTPLGGIATKEKVSLEFRIRKDIQADHLYIKIRRYSGKGDVISFPFSYIKDEEGYSVYQVEFELNEAGIYYYRFEVLKDNDIFFIGRDAFGMAIRGDFLPEWQLTIYNKGYKTPDHLKGGVIYHIFVDRFNKAGNIAFRKKGVLKSWHKDVTIHEPDGSYLADDFFGGNFKGIIEKLDYLESLGVTMIYLSPIFKSFSNHRYDTGDYLKIDELLGDEKDFEELIEKAKNKGMGIMLDGVFNHTGADSIYFNKFNNYDSIGAYQSKKSKYYDWFTFIDFPDKYDCWWGITVVPTVNKFNKEYRKLLFDKGGVIDKWTSMGIKGWRLDVVDELPKDLVDDIRRTVKAIDKDVVIIGEVWEDASTKVAYGDLRPYLIGNQLDGVMNYPFRRAIIDFITYGNVGLFRDRIMSICDHYPKQALDTTMNIIGTHDTSRILNALSGISAKSKAERQKIIIKGKDLELAKKRLRIASTLQFMLPGVPSIYYGDEVGLQGYEDPLNRRPFPWGKEDKDTLDYYRLLGKIRSDYREIMIGNIEFEYQDDLMIFNRMADEAGIKIIANVSGTDQSYLFDRDGVDLVNNRPINKGDLIIHNLEILVVRYIY